MSRRLTALVIGNAAYEHAGVLTNPTNDAKDIAAKLAGCGFTVSKAIDCSLLEMDRVLKRFKKTLAENDVGLFFFAGHGMQIEGENYLAAIDTDTAGEDEAKYSSLHVANAEPGCRRVHARGREQGVCRCAVRHRSQCLPSGLRQLQKRERLAGPH